jgi:shikimate dehydrogenase
VIRAAVLGADVSKSRSPVIHRAAFRALGIDGSYENLSVPASGFAPLVRRLARDGYRYVNVTIPHKLRAARLADRVSPEVRVSRAANTLIFERGGRIRADNTDGAGLIAALADLGVETRGAVIVMVGAGGAAAGALEALTRAGAYLWLLSRRLRAAQTLRARLPPAQQRRVMVAAWDEHLEVALAGATALVSAVPAAAWEAPARRAGLVSLRGSAVVLEMAYGAPTPLARAVRSRVGRYADGLGMLVHQAARAVELALGEAPPVAPMFRAVTRTAP